jgi:hypothetical protein
MKRSGSTWAALGFGLIQAALAFRRRAEAGEEMSEVQHAS